MLSLEKCLFKLKKKKQKKEPYAKETEKKTNN